MSAAAWRAQAGKVALVQCPGYGRECPPHALACLAAYARAQGHEAACFDLNQALYESTPALRKMWDDKDFYSFWEDRAEVARLVADNERTVSLFVRRILDSGAQVVGFTTHTTSFLASLEIAGRIKREDPSRRIVFGGPQCSREQCGRELANDPRVDAVVVGEGEATLADILSAGLRAAPGLILREGARVRDCGDRELIAELGSLPFADYSDFREDILAGRYANPKRLELFDSRGCVRTCHFCSEWQFWKRFRFMTGQRIFDEVRHQTALYPGVSHFYFIGSLLNGNMRELSRFCDLMIEAKLPVTWEGQAIINPRMDAPMLLKMAAAGCRWLGYGVESGSMALRARMNKRFTNGNARATLKATAQAGIKAQINIMFGMPTETRKDFGQTLTFLTRVRPWLDSVLASQSFCVLDKGTIFHREPNQFGITGEQHHLFWKAQDGNDYPERFRRYEEFCKLARFLGLPEGSGVLDLKPDKWLLLGQYYEYEKRWPRAVLCYARSLSRETFGKSTVAALARAYQAAGRLGTARALVEGALRLEPRGEELPLNQELRRRLEELPSRYWDSARVWSRFKRCRWAQRLVTPPPAKYTARQLNHALNESEFAARKDKLLSTPKLVTLGTHNACNAKCVFCLAGRYSRFSLPLYKNFFEKHMGSYIRGAEKITFTGFGEILWVPGIEKILDYLNETLPETEKIFTTNGTPLRPPVVERLLKSRYVIQVSLHASTPALHEELTSLKGQFGEIIENIRGLTRLRDERGLGHRLHVELVDILVNRNLDDLPSLLRLAWDLRVQGVRCHHVTMFAPEHIAMSPFFNQEAANRAVLRAQGAAEALRGLDFDQPFDVRLPPLFGGAQAAATTTCYDPWQHVYVELQGSVLPCCVWGEHVGDLKQGDTLDGIWNGAFYRELRRGMAEGDPHPWCKNCVRYAGFNVDNLLCHLTNRPETQKLLLREIARRGLPLGAAQRQLEREETAA